ncbi:MAG TPA: SusC/RagA family TonB-linked outer membrane protein [Chitinophaga sp.]
MRLSAILLTAAFMQVYASGAAQKVTLSGRNLTLKQVFAAVKKQTGYVVLHNKTLFSGAGTVSLSATGLPLPEFLDVVLKDQSLDYVIRDKTIFLSRKVMPAATAATPLPAPADLPPLITVNGRVVEADGQPIAAVNIVVRGTRKGAISSANGFFSIDVNEGEILDISSVGFVPLSLRATNGNFLVITAGRKDAAAGAPSKLLNAGPASLVVQLAASTSPLDAVQVIAYGATTKRFNTGAQAGIKAIDIERQPVNNPLEALSGRIPGLDISQQSGAAGAGFTIRIRGLNSIRTTANDPLFIVDGIPYSSTDMNSISGYSSMTMTTSPLNALNATDIASIDVLKDADATAIYGSRGANGVIIITTKRGGNTAGKTNVDFNIYQGVGGIDRYAKVLDRRQYLDMRYKAFANDGKDFRTAPATDNYDLMTYDTTLNTNWQKVLLGNTAHFTNAQFTISGGEKNTFYTFAGGYHRQTSVYPTTNADEKYNGRFTLDNTSGNKKFRLQLTTTYGYDDNHLPTYDLVQQALSLPPVAPPAYTTDGHLNPALLDPSQQNNPLQQLIRTYEGITQSLVSNAMLSYEVIPGLVVKASGGISSQQFDSKTLQPASFFGPASQSGDLSRLRTANYESSNVLTTNIEPQAEYKRAFGKDRLNVLVGTTFQTTSTNGMYLRTGGYKDDDLLNSLNAATTITTGNMITKYNYNAIFARISYTMADKYILNLTGRRDGSSRFGAGKQFGNFGAVGAAWLFDQEAFIKNALPLLSYGKLRASYGVTGNDGIPDYNFLATYSAIALSGYPNPPGYGGSLVLAPDKLENPDLAWETNRKAEAAIELGFLKNRILFSFDYYNNRTSNSLSNYPLPTITGNTGIISNIPALIQNTGLEFELTTTNITGHAFNWTSSFNLSLPRNKLIRYDNIESSSYKYTYVVGQPLNIAKVANSYVDPQTGVYTYINAAGKKVSAALLTFDDINRPVDLGKQYYGGFDNNFSYKGFNLDIFLQFTKQTGPYTYATIYRTNFGRINNLPAALYHQVWQQPGDVTNYQKLTASANTPPSTARLTANYDPFFYVNGAYVRLKNLSLSYTLPAGWQQKIHAKNARVYLQGENLLTFTKYPGMDPENFSAALPPLRVMTAGFQLTF